MIDVEVVLAVAAAPNSYLVIGEGQGMLLPYIYMRSGDDSRQLAARLFLEYFGFDCGSWVTLRQVGFIEDAGDERKYVLYAVQLPEPVFILDQRGRWAKTEELAASLDSPAVKLHLKAIQYKG